PRPLPELGVLAKDFIEVVRDLCAAHRTNIDASFMVGPGELDWLHAAVAAVEKVEVHGSRGSRFAEVRLQPQPFSGGTPCRAGSTQIRSAQIRPPPTGLDHGAALPFPCRSHNAEGASACDVLDRYPLACVSADLRGGIPESRIQIKAWDARCGWINIGRNGASFCEQSRLRNPRSIFQQP